MDNMLRVDVSDSDNYLTENVLGYILIHSSPSTNVGKQIPSLADLHEKEVVILCLKPLKKLDNISMPHFR